MSQQNSPGYDTTLVYIIVLVLLAAAVYYGIDFFRKEILVAWSWWRGVQLALIFQFTNALYIIKSPPENYGQVYHYINGFVWSVYKWLVGVPIAAFAIFKFIKNPYGWSMENYLEGVYKRFPWLSMLSDPSIGFYKKKRFPWVGYKFGLIFYDLVFPVGSDPLPYYEKHQDDLPEVLKKQVGPLIVMKGNAIQWRDPWAKYVAIESLKRIPDKSPRPGAKSWREDAWNRCVRTHRYERTLALGILGEARKFGTVSGTRFLKLRIAAARKDMLAFSMWRAVLSFGGRTAYAEAGGVINHYLFEKQLLLYIEQHPEDAEIAQKMRSTPWVDNVQQAFKDLDIYVKDERRRAHLTK